MKFCNDPGCKEARAKEDFESFWRGATVLLVVEFAFALVIGTTVLITREVLKR